MTEHFSAAEFACRDGTPYPAEWLESRLLPLCETLEAIREAVGAPLTILSGYRSPAHNAAVRGAPKSQHVEGRAADIKCPVVPAPELHRVICELHAAGKLPALGGLGAYPGWVHVDVRPRKADGSIARW